MPDTEPEKPAEKPAEKPPEKAPEKPPEKPPLAAQSRVGKFVLTYHTFLSTFVIGAAGLIATSIWQYRQSEISRRQSDSQQAIAKTQAENQWRIERAEILAKNLQVLAAHGVNSADSRYGVLLSLTRGEILDPELAVSYALELGKDNAEYMHSVLSSTQDKDYVQLAHAFVPTCEQRFGVARQVDLCKSDELGPRSDAIARLLSEDAEAWAVTGAPDGGGPGPMNVLRDFRNVQKEPTRFAWLFTPAITDLYQHQQWTEYRRFAAVSPGAHLVAALVLATVRTGEMTSNGGADGANGLHAEEKTWLGNQVMGPSCDDDCRARVADYMLSNFTQAAGDFNDTLKKILARPPAESRATVERLHTRLVRCQATYSDEAQLRDQVLVAALVDALSAPKPDGAVVDNLIDLLALTQEPSEPTALLAWKTAIGRLAKVLPDRARKFNERVAQAAAMRKTVPVALRKVSFCNAADAPVDASQPE
jgi:hypothetical protein